MRSKILKVLSMRFLAYFVAGAGAWAATIHSEDKKRSSLITGYIHLSTFDSCDLVYGRLDRVTGPPCTLSSFSVWDKVTPALARQYPIPFI